MRTPLFFIAVASLLVSACSTTPPTRHRYLLRSDSPIESGRVNRLDPYYLGELQVANYIDQPGLVLELSDGKMHAARYHQWAEPLQVSLREFLSREIPVRPNLPPALAADESVIASRIDIQISQLHGDAAGNAVLVAYWSLQAGNQYKEFQFVHSVALKGIGYTSLVAAEQQLLIHLAKAIASQLR